MKLELGKFQIKDIQFPEYGITHTFQEGENVLEFTPSETGIFFYSCWMGMIRGSILVTDGDPCDTAGAVVSPTETNAVPNGLPACCQ